MEAFWNGEPAKVEVIRYGVTRVEETPLHWQNAIVGSRRQGLVITQDGHSFIIDNETGQGHLKITKGKGSFRFGHASVCDPINIERLPLAMINDRFDIRKAKIQEGHFDSWAQENHPKMFEKLLALREKITKNK